MQRLAKQVKHGEPLKIWGLRNILLNYTGPLQNQCLANFFLLGGDRNMVDKVDEKGNKINRYTYSFIFRFPRVWRNIHLTQLPVSTSFKRYYPIFTKHTNDNFWEMNDAVAFRQMNDGGDLKKWMGFLNSNQWKQVNMVMEGDFFFHF